MMILTLFAFLAGIVTILSPCILPILPIILSGSIDQSRKRPVGIILGFIASFTFFTLFLSVIVTTFNVSADVLRNMSVVLLILFGLSLLVPGFQIIVERMFSKLSRFSPRQNARGGLLSGIVIGFSLGLVWTPCVGPILASVITLAATNTVTLSAALITFAYAVGTAIPMFIFMFAGRKVFIDVPWLLPNSKNIQKVFGLLMIIVAIGIYFNIHKSFQSFILDIFPGYSSAITQIEENELINDELKKRLND